MKRTPMLPRKPSRPSLGVRIFGAVAVASTRGLLFDRTVMSDESIADAARPVNIQRTPMADQKRPYRMKRRAELEEETRRRITESAVSLHEKVGPARTSITAIADLAGVRRSTVYRHFPDEDTLFAACSSHWRALNPPPDLAAWASVTDPRERTETALDELYAFYGRTRRMYESLLRDEALVPSVRPRLRDFHAYLQAAGD